MRLLVAAVALGVASLGLSACQQYHSDAQEATPVAKKDLGRPRMFLNMLRVLKFQSPMSVGSWIVSGFGAAAIPGVVLTEWYLRAVNDGGAAPVLQGFAVPLARTVPPQLYEGLPLPAGLWA